MSLQEGLESGEPGTDDGRFYFHLGDALQRVGDDSVSDTHTHAHNTIQYNTQVTAADLRQSINPLNSNVNVELQ